jgi:hypothetical protein
LHHLLFQWNQFLSLSKAKDHFSSLLERKHLNILTLSICFFLFLNAQESKYIKSLTLMTQHFMFRCIFDNLNVVNFGEGFITYISQTVKIASRIINCVLVYNISFSK